MIQNKVKMKARAAARTGKCWNWEAATVWRARKMVKGDPVSVIGRNGLRTNGVVLDVYIGKGRSRFTRVQVAHSSCTIEDFINCGNKMGRLLAPEAPRVVEFLPYATRGGRTLKPRELMILPGNKYDF